MAKLPENTRAACEAVLNAKVEAVFHTGGGDISQALRLETDKGAFFLKINTNTFAGAMFAAEAKGLQLLASTKIFRIPTVIATSATEAHPAFLLLENIESGNPRPDFWVQFGERLAALHRCKSDHFGLDHANFIGSLPQNNTLHTSWVNFYVECRLLPQMQLAAEEDKLTTQDHQSFERLFAKFPALLPEESPSLIHGDLWNGNFLCDKGGVPVLIDPAICFASREMDLAMALLFGGFDQKFYEAYQLAYPLLPGWEERIDLYQLYYLMVHVNLFGGGYIQSVRQILRRFA